MTINGIGADPTLLPVNQKTDTPLPAPAASPEAAQTALPGEHSSEADAYALTLSLLSYLIIPEGTADKHQTAAKPDKPETQGLPHDNGGVAKVDIAA